MWDKAKGIKDFDFKMICQFITIFIYSFLLYSVFRFRGSYFHFLIGFLCCFSRVLLIARKLNISVNVLIE